MPTSKQGGGGPRARTRCRPTLSAVSPVPSALKGRGPRLVKAPKTRLMPDPLRGGEQMDLGRGVSRNFNARRGSG